MGSSLSSTKNGFQRALVDIHEGTRCRAKDLEKARIFASICGEPGITRTGIIKKLDLRPTSVSHAVNELVAGGLAIELREERGPRRQGRPEIGIGQNKNRFCVIAVHIASRTLKAVLTNGGEESLTVREAVLDETTTNSVFIRKFHTIIALLKEDLPAGTRLLGACLSLPGVMDMEKRQWIFASRWPSIRRLKFRDLERKVDVPLVLSRVLDAGLEYLIAQDKGLEGKDTLLIHWGYGIGASYANSGKVMTSSFGGVCEIGHWRIQENKPRTCTCGSSGCLETEAALWSIIPLLRKEYPDIPEQEDMFYEYLATHADIAGHALLRAATSAMGKAIAKLFVTLFPRKIIVYGPLTILPEIRKALVYQCEAGIPDFGRPYFSMAFLDSGYRGEQIGNARKLFLAEYRKHLRAGVATG